MLWYNFFYSITHGLVQLANNQFFLFMDPWSVTITRSRFHQHFMRRFYAYRSQTRKKIVKSRSFLHFWICTHKSWALTPDLGYFEFKTNKNIFFQVYVACSIHLFSLAKFWPEYDQVIVLIIVTFLFCVTTDVYFRCPMMPSLICA